MVTVTVWSVHIIKTNKSVKLTDDRVDGDDDGG